MFDSENEKFMKDPLAYMRKRSICPPDNIVGDNTRGNTATRLDTSTFVPTFTSLNAQPRDIRYARVMNSMKVAYIKMFKDKRKDPNIRNDEGVDTIRFKSQFGSKAGYMPVYFLPWDVSGAIVRLTIPAKGTMNPDPDIFFTAAINGCSVFVQGADTTPTVYHAGGDTGQSDHNQAARFWREALQRHINNTASAGARGRIMAEVNKTDYIKTPGTIGNSTTPKAMQYEALLKQNLDKGKFSVYMVNPWGCVMGIRTGNNWSFYLQENGTVICNIVSKTGVEVRKYSRPMGIRKIFPGGGSSVADLSMQMPVKVIRH